MQHANIMNKSKAIPMKMLTYVPICHAKPDSAPVINVPIVDAIIEQKTAKFLEEI